MNKKQQKTSAKALNSAKIKTKLVLGVSGGIAAYKSADLVRRLIEVGFDVRVVMTRSAQEFITPLTMQAVSGHSVHNDLFDCQSEAAMGHIELAKWADIILVAPATANILAKLAMGIADDLLTTIVLATTARMIVSPAMNQQMWANPAVQDNLNRLIQRDFDIIEPESGEQACGDVGQGRMPEPADLANYVSSKFLSNSDALPIRPMGLARPAGLAGKKLVITAGPTREAIDPVRYISNHSSGKMGYALAREASRLGARVTLISGPVEASVSDSIVQCLNLINVKTAEEMLAATRANIEGCDAFIGCAAVADYRAKDIAEQKIKKANNEMAISLIKNPDVLKWVSDNKRETKSKMLVVGFAAESQNLKAFAFKKLEQKKLDLICANDISLPGVGFNSSNNQLLVLDSDGNETSLPTMSKNEIANRILEIICAKI